MKKIILIAIAAVCALSSRAANLADPAVSPRVYTLGTITVTNATATTANLTNALYATFGYTHSMSVFTTVGSSNNARAVLMTNYFDLSLDGTNFTSSQPLQTVFTANSGTNVYCTIIPATSFDGCKSIRWTSTSGAALGSGTNVNVTVQLGLTP